MSELDTLEQVAKTLGEEPPELSNLPQLPECAEHVWLWWVSLSNKRQNGMSVNPISEESMGWFFHTRNIHPLTWELEALDGIESAWLSDYNSQQTKK